MTSRAREAGKLSGSRAGPRSDAADFQAVFETVERPLLLIAADPPRFTMVAVNAAHARAFRTTPAALLGRGVIEVFGENLPPEVQRFVDAVRGSLTQVLTVGASHEMPPNAVMMRSASGEREQRYVSATNSPITDANGRVTHIVSAVQDVTGEVLERRNEEARALLMREIDHRARNMLSLVQSLVRLAAPATLGDFRNVLEGRISALSRAQASLMAQKWQGAAFEDLVKGALGALAQPGQYAVEGERVLLGPELAQPMSMVLHELATNASKYGGLSTTEARLQVSWTVSPERLLRLTWTEDRGAPIAPPTGQGFGTRLIDQLLRQVGGEVTRTWTDQGLTLEITAPLTAPAAEPAV